MCLIAGRLEVLTFPHDSHIMSSYYYCSSRRSSDSSSGRSSRSSSSSIASIHDCILSFSLPLAGYYVARADVEAIPANATKPVPRRIRLTYSRAIFGNEIWDSSGQMLELLSRLGPS